MPIWVYNVPPLVLALLMVVTIAGVSLVGLLLTRRFLLPRFHYHDGVNDAISGTVQTIGVFYGITVGLIAVGVYAALVAVLSRLDRCPPPRHRWVPVAAPRGAAGEAA